MNDDIGLAHLPNQRYKIVSKRGATFTLMLCGESGVGKTTFVNTLFSTAVKAETDSSSRFKQSIQKTVEIGYTKAELEEQDFKLRLNVIDTPGFGDNVNNSEAWAPVVEFIDEQHERYMRQEQQPNRGGRNDLRVHACLYFIRPSGHTLKPLDIAAMKALGTRVNVIPIIAKADTLSPQEINAFKEKIRQVIVAQGIKVYTPTPESLDGPNDPINELMKVMPFSVIGSEKEVETPDGRVVRGRQYLWGIAEVENEEHCDFVKLRQLLIRSHMLDLIHSTEDTHYEAYRAEEMQHRKLGEGKERKLVDPKFKEEEEALRSRFTEQVKAEERRFREWESKLIADRDRLNKDLEETHAKIKELEQEYDQLAQQMRKR